jgi:DNA-nicking Smr family endonuclease
MVRRLDGEEKALWGRVISSVKPLHPVRPLHPVKPIVQTPRAAASPAPKIPKKREVAKPAVPVKTAVAAQAKSSVPSPPDNLDGSWDRRIGKGGVIPDVSVDLHGQGLSSAYRRLDGALEQAIAQKLRVILLVTGKARAHDRMSGEGRGAIASVVRDWLAASRHSAAISAVRNAHPRHGGTGALYIILKR